MSNQEKSPEQVNLESLISAGLPKCVAEVRLTEMEETELKLLPEDPNAALAAFNNRLADEKKSPSEVNPEGAGEVVTAKDVTDQTQNPVTSNEDVTKDVTDQTPNPGEGDASNTD